MFYNPNAIDSDSAVLSTYCLLVTSALLVGNAAIVADVNTAVLGTVAPITVLFIEVLTTGTLEPVAVTTPNVVPSIFKIILFAASNCKSVGELIDVIPRPSIFNVPPTYKSPATPSPPATVSAPVLELVEASVPVTCTALNALGGFETLIVPNIVPEASA